MKLAKRIIKFSLELLLVAFIFMSIASGKGILYGVHLAEQIGVLQPNILVAGTGSMYPTFPKGTGQTNIDRINEVVGSHKMRTYPAGIVLFGHQYFGYTLQRGDIVVFENDKTRQILSKESSDSATQDVGFIKRIIALPGDTIEIRDGFVRLNGSIISEPYIASARSTYGGQFLADCQVLKVPDHKYFVMGDNRKGSDDSRFDVGLVDEADINGFIPATEQQDLRSHWRDTSKDTADASRPTLDPNQFLVLLNQKRAEAGLKPLTYQPKLEQSAAKRANIILKYNDLSFEATRSGYTMKSALEDVGYSNVITGEAPTFGFYTAEELIDNYFQFPKTKAFLLDPQFQETGVAAVLGQVNGCPVQVVVQHLAGYIPPTYSPDEAGQWQKLIDNLNNVIPSWEKAKDDPTLNKDDLNKLIDLLQLRLSHAQSIEKTIQSNQWLSDEQNNWIQQDSSLHDQIQSLTNKLNSR